MQEQEGGMEAEGLSSAGAGGIAAIVMAALSGAALWWERRTRKPRTDAEQAADVAGLSSWREVIEMLRQELRTQQAEINDLRTRSDEQRQRTDKAELEVIRLRGELAQMQQQLQESEGKRATAEDTVQQLKERVAVLEAELRKRGIEVPR